MGQISGLWKNLLENKTVPKNTERMDTLVLAVLRKFSRKTMSSLSCINKTSLIFLK